LHKCLELSNNGLVLRVVDGIFHFEWVVDKVVEFRRIVDGLNVNILPCVDGCPVTAVRPGFEEKILSPFAVST